MLKTDCVVEVVGYIMRVYGHFHLNGYDPYVVMQAFVVSFQDNEWKLI